MADNKAKLIFESDNRVKRGVKSLRRMIQGVGKAAATSTKAVKAMAGSAVSVMKRLRFVWIGATAAIAASVREAHLFARRMAEVNTMLSKSDIRGFSRDVQNLSAELGLTKDELAGGLYQTLSAGVPENNSIDFLTTSAKAAVAGVTQVDTAVDALTTVINSYKFKASDAAQVSDILFTTVKLGKTTFGELSKVLAQVTPVAAASGVRFEDLASAFATMTKQGIKTSMVSTQLRSAILETTRVLGDGWTKSLNLADGFAEVVKMAGGSQTALRKMVGSVEAMSAILAMTGANASGAKGDLKEFAEAGGATENAFKVMDKVREWEVAWQSFRSVMTSFGSAIKSAVAPHIREFAGWLNRLANKRGAFKQLRDDVKAFVDYAAPQLKMVGGLLKDMFDTEKRGAAFKNIGALIRAAFEDAGTILENKLIPIAQKVGFIISQALYDVMPKRFKKNMVNPSEKMVTMPSGIGVPLGWTQGVTYEAKEANALSTLMEKIKKQQGAGGDIFSQAEIGQFDQIADALFGPSGGGPLQDRATGGPLRRKKAANKKRAKAVVASLGGEQSHAEGMFARGINIGDVFTKLRGQDFTKKKREPQFDTDGGMKVHVTNQQLKGGNV